MRIQIERAQHTVCSTPFVSGLVGLENQYIKGTIVCFSFVQEFRFLSEWRFCATGAADVVLFSMGLGSFSPVRFYSRSSRYFDSQSHKGEMR